MTNSRAARQIAAADTELARERAAQRLVDRKKHQHKDRLIAVEHAVRLALDGVIPPQSILRSADRMARYLNDGTLLDATEGTVVSNA
jgi:hypothetical protein